jgi:rhamnosyltransferase
MKIAIVIIFYNPRNDALDTVRAFSSAGIQVYVVVNSASIDVMDSLVKDGSAIIIRNSTNVGLAIALNQGITAVFADRVNDAVFLLDQDSKPSMEMLNILGDALTGAMARGISVGCVGPKLIDIKAPSADVSRCSECNTDGLVTVETIATSGMLIHRTAFLKIGSMMESLFIDCIDHEWCLRAATRGMGVFVVPKAEMFHDMGDAAIKVFGRFKPLHRSPMRHYYIIRNHFYMLRLPYIPFRWKVKESLKSARRFFAYLVISSDPANSFKLMCRAIANGILDKFVVPK